MNCCIDEICNKDVINIDNGCRVGMVNDVEIDTCSGQVNRIFVSRNDKTLQFRRPEYIKIFWKDIVIIGEETILVKNVAENETQDSPRKNIFGIFSR